MKVIYYRVALVNNEWVLTHSAYCRAGRGVTYMLSQRDGLGDFLSTVDTEDGDTWAYLGLVFSEDEHSRGVIWEPITNSTFDPSLKNGPSKEDFDLYLKEYMENLNRIYQGDPVLKKITFFSQSHKTLSEDVIRAKLLANTPKADPIKLFLLERSPTDFMYRRVRIVEVTRKLTDLPNTNILGMRHSSLGTIYFTFDHFALKDAHVEWEESTTCLVGHEIKSLGNLLTSYATTPPGMSRLDVPEVWFGSNDKELISYEQLQLFLLTGVGNKDSSQSTESVSEPLLHGEPPVEKDIYYQIADVRRLIDKRRHELANLNNQLSELENRLAQCNKTERGGVPYTQQFGYGHHHFTRG